MLSRGRPTPLSKALYLQADSKGWKSPKGITFTLTRDDGFSIGTPGEFSSRYMQPVSVAMKGTGKSGTVGKYGGPGLKG